MAWPGVEPGAVPECVASGGRRPKTEERLLVLPFAEQHGAEIVERYRHGLLNPLSPSAADLPGVLRPARGTGRLARPGEAGDAAVDKRRIWETLRDCKDEQLYTADVVSWIWG